MGAGHGLRREEEEADGVENGRGSPRDQLDKEDSDVDESDEESVKETELKDREEEMLQEMQVANHSTVGAKRKAMEALAKGQDSGRNEITPNKVTKVAGETLKVTDVINANELVFMYAQEMQKQGAMVGGDMGKNAVRIGAQKWMFRSLKMIMNNKAMMYDGPVFRSAMKVFKVHKDQQASWWAEHAGVIRMAINTKRNNVISALMKKVTGMKIKGGWMGLSYKVI